MGQVKIKLINHLFLLQLSKRWDVNSQTNEHETYQIRLFFFNERYKAMCFRQTDRCQSDVVCFDHIIILSHAGGQKDAQIKLDEET